MEPRSSCLVSLALFAACSSSGDPGAQVDAGPGDDGGGEEAELSCVEKGGSRLRQQVRDHDDGSSEVLALIDSERGLACTFGAAADGQLRCLPESDQNKVYAGLLKFRDSSCSQRLAQVAAGVEPLLFEYWVPVEEGCDQPPRRAYAELGAATDIEAGDRIYYRNLDGDCVAETASGSTYYQVAELIPPERFVAGTASWTDGGRLSMQTIDAEDGARFCDVDGTLRDSDLDDGECHLQRAEDGSLRCLPNPTALSEFFSDDDCTSSLELTQSRTCRQETYISTRSDTCDDRDQVRLVGDTVTSQLYWDPGGVCDTFDPGDTTRFSLPGPVVAPETFAEMRRDYVPGGERLERGDLVGEGIRMHRSRWWDTELEMPCGFAVASDGAERCLPAVDPQEVAAVNAGTRYTDDDCTVGVLVAAYRPGCTAATPIWVREFAGGMVLIHQVADEHAGSFYVREGERCLPAPADEVHLRLGPVVDPAMFASGVQRLE
jgi:hypothetical protein